MKNKILILLLLFGSAFTFVFTSSKAQAEFVNDTFVISNIDNNINEEDFNEFLLYLIDYVDRYDLLVFNEEENGFFTEFHNENYGGLHIDFISQDYTVEDFTFYFMYFIEQEQYGFMLLSQPSNVVFDLYLDINTNEFLINNFGTNDFKLVFTLVEIPEVPLFTGLINFISNFLQDLLKSITDMTMHLINNIWDTNLIDINFVILSDTAIYSGTLNDMLYSVFSIFYVIFAITVVWRLLKKLLRKLFSIVRW